MTVLAPLPGDPDAVRLLAERLATTGERLSGLAAVLVRLRDEGAVWDGPAGRAFAARIGPLPGVIDAAARRHLGAVAPLRALADALEDAQVVIAAAQREHDAAEGEYTRLEDHAWTLTAAGVAESDAALLAVRLRQRENVEAMQRAGRRHALAVERFRDEDRRSASRLRTLADDGLADPWAYRALRGAGALGDGLGSTGALVPVAPELGPVSLAGDALGAVSGAGLLVGYGEGRWSYVAARAGLAAVGFGGAALRSGAIADGARAGRRLSTQERLAAGAAREARRRIAATRARLHVPDPGSTPSALLGGPAVRTATRPAGSTLRRNAVAARAAARAAAERAFLADWRAATGQGTRPMYVAGVTLQAGAAAGEKATDRAEQRERRSAGP